MGTSMLDDDQQREVDTDKIFIFCDNLFTQGERNWNLYPAQVSDLFNKDKDDAINIVRAWLIDRKYING